jgi:hypothetical protein
LAVSGRVAREGLALAIMSAACLRLDFNERNNGLTIRPRCFLPIRARSFPNTIENGYFAGQSPDVRAKGLAWIAEQIRAAGGNIEEAMERFSQETEKPTGFSEDELQVGDQVHFRNPASKEVGPEVRKKPDLCRSRYVYRSKYRSTLHGARGPGRNSRVDNEWASAIARLDRHRQCSTSATT